MKKLILVTLFVAACAFAQQSVKRELSCLSSAASSTDYACSIASAPAAYVSGERYLFKADSDNTASAGKPTINFNSLGAKKIVKYNANVTTELAAGDICADQWVAMIYDGTNMQMTSPTCNAPAAGSGGVGSLQFAWGAASGLAAGTNYLQVNGLITVAAAIANRETVVPAACTAQNAYVVTNSTQGAGGSLVFTLYKDVAGTPTATALQVTVPAGNAAGTFSDTTHQVSLSAGDRIAWQFVNNHSSTGAALLGLSFQCK